MLRWCHDCVPLCRYMQTPCNDYWQGDLESALRPHPVLLGTNLNPVVSLK